MIALRPVNQIPAAMTTPPPDASATPHPDEVNRLWQHGLHEEKLFYDRLNYFAAIQVGLLGVFAILYHKEPAVGVVVPLTAAALGRCLEGCFRFLLDPKLKGSIGGRST